MKRFVMFLNLIFILSFIAGCNKDGENSVTTELLRPVNVFISGNVISADTGAGVAGVEIRIQRVLADGTTEFIKNSGGTDLTILSDAGGNFDFGVVIPLEVDTYQHFLYISDPTDNYYINDSQVVYSIRDAELNYSNVRIISKNPRVTTIVTGTVRNVLSDAAVPGAAIRLTHATDSTIIHTATSAADGTFAMESVAVSEYTLRVDGSALTPTTFVVEDSTVKLAGGDTNDLGSLRIAPTINSDDLRIVLQWNQSAGMDLDIQYTFPRPNLDFNHCGVKTIDMGASDFSMNPAYGFAAGTSYWPENMGGEARLAITDRDEPGRYTLDKDAGTVYTDSYWPDTDNKYVVGGQTIAELDRNSTDGSTPEVLTIHKQNFLGAYPDTMSYYYNYIKGTQITKFFPAALGIFSVKNAGSTSIYNSGAVVKVYQGNTFLGKFSVSDLSISAGESNKKYWNVLQVEQGYTKASPASADDIYFRVVPYGSQSATLEVTPPSPGFYFSLVGLPYNKTYTSYADFSPLISDLLFPIKHMRMIGSKDGYIYSMFCNDINASSKNYVWRTGWYGHFPGSEITSIVVNRADPMYYNISLKNQPSSGPWEGSSTLTSGYGSCFWREGIQQLSGTATDDYGTYKIPESIYASLTTAKINCMVEYRDYSLGGSYKIMFGTESGPKQSDVFSFIDFEGTPPTGNVVSICPLMDEYGVQDGRVLVATDNNLYKYDSNQTNAADRWSEVKVQTTDSSISSVVAIVALNKKFGTKAIIIKNAGGIWTVGNYLDDLSNSKVAFYNGSWDTKTVNSLKIITIGAFNYLFYATSDGVYYRSLHYLTPMPPAPIPNPLIDNELIKLSSLLDGINVLKIIDYDGKIGLLTENNGFIVGPYPPLSWEY